MDYHYNVIPRTTNVNGNLCRAQTKVKNIFDLSESIRDEVIDNANKCGFKISTLLH